jgi:RHS repeat-associated protein
VVGATETWYVYGLDGELVAEYPAEGAVTAPQQEYGYRAGQLLVVVPCDGGVRWLVADHLGSPRIEADGTGSLGGIKRHDYLPFGEEVLAGHRIDALGQPINGYVTADCVRQRFGAKERDTETGLDFCEARYLSSMQGRFTSPDPLYYTAERPGDPQRFNLYAYVRNAPLSFIDPDGKDAVGSSGAAGEALTEEDRRRLQQGLARIAPGTRVDANGTVHKPGFFRRALNHLTGHGAGTTLVSRLVDSKYTTNIVIRAGSNSASASNLQAASDGTGSNATVFWDPNNTLPDETRVPDANGNITAVSPIEPRATDPDLNLGHELIHADHITTGTRIPHMTQAGKIQLPNVGTHLFVEGTTLHAETYRPEELRTTGFAPFVRKGDITENQLRRELGLAPRAAYLSRKQWDR